jgi:general transcription factor 3C polypeptide 3 (transcription factor C subunit 4)
MKLDYFFRAYALDPENPMIKLSIGLGYVHHGLKRQSENRQFQIMQGMTFLLDYYKSRRASDKAEERQEASYNVARTYQMVGLSHLALPYYQEILDEAQSSETKEDLVLDAAFNLQTMYSMSGNMRMADYITSTWLQM